MAVDCAEAGVMENRQIVLLSADGVGTNGTAKTTVWRWQARSMKEGVDGLLTMAPDSNCRSLMTIPMRISGSTWLTITRLVGDGHGERRYIIDDKDAIMGWSMFQPRREQWTRQRYENLRSRPQLENGARAGSGHSAMR